MKFKVSVIIPAYNVEQFIEKAVHSALESNCVNEVVVVNDGSTDNTLKVLNVLKNQYKDRINVYHHYKEKNKGRSASRNLGIKKSTSNYIAFLDADDFYLGNRFEKEESIFLENPEIEVVYNAVGFSFYRSIKLNEEDYFKKLNTVTKPLESTDVFEALISSKYGYLHLNGLTVNKNVFNIVGYFNEELPVAEDSDFIFKLGIKCDFMAGDIKNPVALRGIHDNNIFNNNSLYKSYNIKLYESLLLWCYKQNVPKKQIDVVLKWLWEIKFREKKTIGHYMIYWFSLSLKFPQSIFSKFFVKYCPIVRLRKKIIPYIFR